MQTIRERKEKKGKEEERRGREEKGKGSDRIGRDPSELSEKALPRPHSRILVGKEHHQIPECMLSRNTAHT